jgi:hypothetical protein
MRLPILMLSILTPAACWAEAFQRPIPQPQTEQAEIAYLVASLIFLAALIGVQMLVNRR